MPPELSSGNEFHKKIGKPAGECVVVQFFIRLDVIQKIGSDQRIAISRPHGELEAITRLSAARRTIATYCCRTSSETGRRKESGQKLRQQPVRIR